MKLRPNYQLLKIQLQQHSEAQERVRRWKVGATINSNDSPAGNDAKIAGSVETVENYPQNPPENQRKGASGPIIGS
jgi:hypothetical protein